MIPRTVFCVAEDRESELVGVQLLILSLQDHCPGSSLKLTCPNVTEGFARWLHAFPNVELRTRRLLGSSGWNVKPHAILQLLEEGYHEIIWLDSDIIINSDFRHILQGLSDDMLVVCEETKCGQLQGGVHRTISWGFEPGRWMPVTANTGLIRATHRHKRLLRVWQALLQCDQYRTYQAVPSQQRPIHMLSDQEVLTGILGAREFCDVPISFIKRGREIIQNFGPAGYAVLERLRNTFYGLPPLIHAMGRKPWRFNSTPAPTLSMREAYDALCAELSPYNYVARRYKEKLGGPAPWLDRSTLLGRIMDVLTLHNPSLRGLPQAIFDTFVRYSKRLLGLDCYRVQNGQVHISTSKPVPSSPQACEFE